MGRTTSHEQRKGVIQTLQLYYIYFFLGCIVGFLFEFALDNLYYRHPYILQGPLHGPWLMVYGFGGVFIIALVKATHLKERKIMAGPVNLMPAAIFVMIFLIAGLTEFCAAWLLDTFFDMKPWDYSNKPFNIMGLTCLEDVLRFAILGLICLYTVVPLLDHILEKTGRCGLNTIFLITAALLLTDVIYSAFNPLHAVSPYVGGSR